MGGWRGGEGDYCPERCMHLSAATVRGNYLIAPVRVAEIVGVKLDCISTGNLVFMYLDKLPLR